MKKKFEEKLKKDFPKRRDGQKTTLELIPELGTFVEPFFPKGPPPGAMRPGGAGPPPPPGPATHAPPPADENWVVPSLGCNTTDNTVFYLQIGPAAVKRGNQGKHLMALLIALIRSFKTSFADIKLFLMSNF